jgi:LexA-binding, inner membrane-associated putative hydrolase
MANFNIHAVAGGTTGVVLNVTKQWTQMAILRERSFDWGEMLAWGAVGVLAASLPDILEPANSPRHRKFLHSLVLGGLILFGIFGKPSRRLREDLRELIVLAGLGYLSHLALDIVTPAGLPIA